jgi:hypothetical protein
MINYFGYVHKTNHNDYMQFSLIDFSTQEKSKYIEIPNFTSHLKFVCGHEKENILINIKMSINIYEIKELNIQWNHIIFYGICKSCFNDDNYKVSIHRLDNYKVGIQSLNKYIMQLELHNYWINFYTHKYCNKYISVVLVNIITKYI